MSDAKFGTIVWRDLTVDNADGVRDFYSEVVGWDVKPHPMGEYDDYEMVAKSTGETIAGVCHARGSNAGVPPQWLMYVLVEDVVVSAARCEASGGKVVDGPRMMGKQNFCVVQDPAGAVLALIEG